MNWIDWYFQRARQRVSAQAHDLFWNQIKPACSSKMLAQICQGTLDIPDPTVVDWRFIRPAHLWLKRDSLDKRTLSTGMYNIKRIVAAGGQRRINPWFIKQMGWKSSAESRVISLLSEADYDLIEVSALEGLPEDFALGVRAILRLMYYAGISHSRLAQIRYNDIVFVDGRTLVYSGGYLLELPPHVSLPLIAWIRHRAEAVTKGRKPSGGDSRVFRVDQARVGAKFPKLIDTYNSLRRLRG